MDLALNRLHTLTVKDVMARSVVWVPARMHMAEVAQLMLRHEVSTVPVVDEEGVCVGILSAADFLKRDSAVAEESGVSSRVRPEWRPDDVAATFMSTAVQSIPASTALLQAARIMTAQHIHHLPIIDQRGKPLGMVSTMDLISALLHALHEQSIAQ